MSIHKSLGIVMLGSVLLVGAPSAIAASVAPFGSVYNPGASNLYQPGENTVTEQSMFAALPLEGVTIKNLRGVDQGELRIGNWLSYPQDRNWLVFSVTIAENLDVGSQNMQAGGTTQKVFRYNLNTHQLQRIYREHQDKSDAKSFMLLGFDGNRLIVGKSGWDNSPGPCWSQWDTADKDFSRYSLDMRTPWKGLKSYSPPKKLVEQGKAEVQECLKQI
jgi:hypothetical protein